MFILEGFVAVNDGGFDHVWGGRVIEKGLPCLILSAEDDRADIDNRLRAIRATSSAPPQNHGYIIPCSETGSMTLFEPSYPGGPIAETEAYRWLDEELGRMRARAPNFTLGFVAIDTLSALTSFNENDNGEASAIMTGLGRLAAKHDVTVLILHHLAKGGTEKSGGISGAGSIRGASALVNSARLAIGIEHVTGDDAKKAMAAAGAVKGRVIRMQILKANGPVNRTPVTFAWPDGCGTIDVSDLIGDSSAESALVAIIKDLNRKGIEVTKSGSKDGIYQLKSEAWPESIKSLGRDRLQRLVQGALDTGSLYLIGNCLCVPEVAN